MAGKISIKPGRHKRTDESYLSAYQACPTEEEVVSTTLGHKELAALRITELQSKIGEKKIKDQNKYIMNAKKILGQ